MTENESLQVEATGETVGEAKWAALRELEKLRPGIDKAAVRFQVVSEGERGLLGVGFAPARVVALVEAAAAIRLVESEHDLLVCARQRADRVDGAERDNGRLLARQRQAVQQFVEFLAVSGIELGVDSQRPKRARVVPRP